MSHRTQRRPLVLTATQTRSFLAQKVDVYEQTKIGASSSGRVVSVGYQQLEPMTREAFYRMYVVWYANKVLNDGLPMASVQAAVAAIKAGVNSAQSFEDSYLDYVFTPGTTDMGYYAKDNEMPVFLKVRRWLLAVERHMEEWGLNKSLLLPYRTLPSPTPRTGLIR